MNQKKKKKKEEGEERKEGSSGSTDNIPPIPAARPVSATRSLPHPSTPTDGAEARDPGSWVLGTGDPLECTKVIEPLDIFYLNLLNILLCIISAPVQSVLGTKVHGYDLYRGKAIHTGYFLTEVLIAWIWGSWFGRSPGS